MNILGIEVRKANNLFNLYNDIDIMLKSNNIKKESISQDLQIATVALTLQKMIKHDSYFSVCTIDNCSKVAGIIIPVERYNIYRAIHCMDWNQMTPEYRQLIIAMVLDDFKLVFNK